VPWKKLLLACRWVLIEYIWSIHFSSPGPRAHGHSEVLSSFHVCHRVLQYLSDKFLSSYLIILNHCTKKKAQKKAEQHLWEIFFVYCSLLIYLFFWLENQDDWHVIKILDDYHCLFRLMEDLFYIGYCKTSQVINRCIYFILFLILVGGVFLVGK
jgi:hypothetical protein